LDGVAGVEPQTETVWRQADRHRVPRIVFVNKLDRVGADYARALAELHTRLSARAVAVTWPLYEDNTLAGVVDLVELTEIRWTDNAGWRFTAQPARLSDNLVSARERLLEAAADEDPEILAAVVDGRPVDAARVRAALRRGTIAGRLVPVLA